MVAGASGVHEGTCKECSESKTLAAATPRPRSLVDIYKMTNTRHPKRLAYVGQAVQVLLNGEAHGTKRRVASHFREARTDASSCRALNAAIREENSPAAWQVETLDSVSFEDADAAEIFWINHFNTYKGPGYNLTPGGRGFAELTAEGRAQLSMSMRKHDTERSMYIYQVSNQRQQGYGVSIPTIGKHVVFKSTNLTMPAKLARAEAYLKACTEAIATGSELPAHRTDTRPSSIPGLPRYISKLTSKGKVCLRVHCKPYGKPLLFDKKIMSGSFDDMLSKAKAYLADQVAQHDMAAHIGIDHTEQPVTPATSFDNKENSGTVSANTKHNVPMFHHSSNKGKLQRAAQAPGQSKLAFTVQKRCNQ